MKVITLKQAIKIIDRKKKPGAIINKKKLNQFRQECSNQFERWREMYRRGEIHIN